MNNKKFCLLYLDVELGGDLLGRIIIEPLPSPKTVEFSSFFQSLTSHIIGADSLADVVETKPHDLVQFQWNSQLFQHKPFNSPYFLFNMNERQSEPSLLFDETELTSGAVIVCTDFPQQFCIVTSPWHIMTADAHGCLVGRIYKGMTVVNHLTTMETESDMNLLKKCKVNKVGIIGPGQSLGIQPSDAVLDKYPSAPVDAMDVDFTNIDSVLCVSYGIKTSGSIMFRQNKFEMAMCKFKKAVRYLTHAAEKHSITREQEIRMLSVIVPCILDSAACKLKMKDFAGALEDCNEALEICPMNAKIFFRRGQANHGKMNYEQSLYDLYTALNMTPNDKSIKSEIAAVEGEMQVYKKIDRRRSSSDTSVEAQ